ncbi:MFS transporter [Bartonella sp. DGB1]|uniref:MFS transporter n=1 Tax=Bartonella sp. DGB1 TaxID=3239807 RepID=UPI0035269882
MKDRITNLAEGRIFRNNALQSFGFILASLFLTYAQSFSMNLALASIPQLQAELSLTKLEVWWLYAAYMIPLVSMSFFLIKIRTQYGLRNFSEVAIFFFLFVCIFNVVSPGVGYYPLLLTRFLLGIAAAPIASVAFLYMMQAFSEEKKYTIGMSLQMTHIALGLPFARLVSPYLLSFGGYNNLYYFEIGLAFSALALIYIFPLIPIDRQRVISRWDIINYLIIAIGLGANAIAMMLGTLVWWTDASWIGVLIIISIFCFMLAITLELYRSDPFIDLKWLFRAEVFDLIFLLIAFRLLLSEQSFFAGNFFLFLGFADEQLHIFYFIIISGILLGGSICALLMRLGREDIFHIIALSLLAIGSFMASFSTRFTVPSDLYVAHFLIAVGSAMFLPPTMMRAFAIIDDKNQLHLLSFIAVFLITQNTGGIISAAFFRSFEFVREKIAYFTLVEHLQPQFNISPEQLVTLNEELHLDAGIIAYNDIFLLYSIFSVAILLFFIIKISLKKFIFLNRKG